MFRRRRHASQPAEPTATPATPDGEPTCAAPHAMLRFTPDGRVLVCCANDQHALGMIGTDSLREIWDGEERARIAAALDALDYSLGCDECGVERAIGNRANSIEAMWDDLHEPPGPYHWPRRMEFAISNTCNLQCVQCNGDRSSSIRSQREHRPPMANRYDDAFFDELVEFLPHLEVASFAGGEPFLARETRRIFDLMIDNGWKPKCDVVTNTTMFDERVEHYLRELEMDVTLSIDGVTKETFEAIRVGADHTECWENTERFLEVTKSYGGRVTINFCLMPQNWHEFGALLLRADGLDVQVDVIPVTYPQRFNILRMPEEDLRRAVESLEAEGAEIGPRLGRNKGVWDRRVALLRHQLELLESGEQQVFIGARAEASDELLAAIRTELHEWAGQDLIEVRIVDGIIEEVDAPAWAAPLAAERWVGWANEVVLPDLVDRLGVFHDFEMVEGDDGTQRVSYWFDVGGQRVPFRSIIVDGYLIGASPVRLDQLVPAGA